MRNFLQESTIFILFQVKNTYFHSTDTSWWVLDKLSRLETNVSWKQHPVIYWIKNMLGCVYKYFTKAKHVPTCFFYRIQVSKHGRAQGASAMQCLCTGRCRIYSTWWGWFYSQLITLAHLFMIIPCLHSCSIMPHVQSCLALVECFMVILDSKFPTFYFRKLKRLCLLDRELQTYSSLMYLHVNNPLWK